MKSISFCALLLVTIMPSFLDAQNIKQIEQAISLLENYNNKAYQAIQNVIQCSQSNATCNQVITQALTINGLIRAALKTIEVGTTPKMNKKIFKKPISRI